MRVSTRRNNAFEPNFRAQLGFDLSSCSVGVQLVAGFGLILVSLALILGLAALAWFAFFRTRWRLLGPALAVPLVLLFGFDLRPDVLINNAGLQHVAPLEEFPAERWGLLIDVMLLHQDFKLLMLSEILLKQFQNFHQRMFMINF